MADVASAIWFQKRTEKRLSSSSFSAIIFGLSRTLQGTEANSAPDSCGAARVISAFEHARLIRTAADRCLPRSIAMALRLARYGYRADVVLGVKLAPFAAHCWVQCGDEVLNDSLEEVQRYVPILVI